MTGTRDKDIAYILRPAVLAQSALVIAGIAVLVLVLWQLSDLLLLGFGAVVVATVLHSLAGLIERYTPLKRPWSLAVASIAVAGLIVSFAYLLGAQIYEQASNLMTKLPEMVSAAGERFGIQDLPGLLASKSDDFIGRSGLVGDIAGYSSVVVGSVVNLLLVIVGGIYLSISPSRYLEGFLILVPAHVRGKIGSAMENAGRALRYWLLGQIISMTIVGMLTTAGLYLIGMPSALALGFFAGVAGFVPIVGALLSALPAVLLALSEGGSMIYWVLGLYVLVQQIEGNLIMPLVQRQAVDLPPVIGLFALVGLGILFGPLGVLLAAPLTVVLYVAVKQFYVRDTLGEKTEVPGED